MISFSWIWKMFVQRYHSQGTSWDSHLPIPLLKTCSCSSINLTLLLKPIFVPIDMQYNSLPSIQNFISMCSYYILVYSLLYKSFAIKTTPFPHIPSMDTLEAFRVNNPSYRKLFVPTFEAYTSMCIHIHCVCINTERMPPLHNGTCSGNRKKLFTNSV